MQDGADWIEDHREAGTGQQDDLSSVALMMDVLGLVGAPPEQAFDKYTQLVSTLLSVPVALVSFVQEDRDRQFFKSQVGLPEPWATTRQTPLSHSFCQYVKQRNTPLIIENAPDHALVCDNMAIPDLGVRAYLGVPIHGPFGEALGALCAIDVEVRTWRDSDIRIMTDLAACVTDQIRLRAALRQAHGIDTAAA